MADRQPSHQSAVMPSKTDPQFAAWVRDEVRKRKLMKRQQATVQQWLADNTTVAPAKLDDQGKPIYLSSQWASAAQEAFESGLAPPVSILYGLNDVLDHREGITKWYQAHGSQEEAESNNSHSAFNQQLRSAFELLQSSAQPVASASAAPPNERKTNGNLYQALASLAQDSDDIQASCPEPDSTAIEFQAQPTARQLARLAAQAEKIIDMDKIDAALRHYLSGIIAARGIIYEVWDISLRDSTFLLIAARCYANTTLLMTYALEAVRSKHQSITRAITLELSASSMQKMPGICDDSLRIALDVLEVTIVSQALPYDGDRDPSPAPNRNNTPQVLNEDAYRDAVVRLLSAISADDLIATHDTTIRQAQAHHALCYIARALLGERDLLTAALLITTVVDTTHIFLWASPNGDPAAAIVKDHLGDIEKKILRSLKNPTFITTGMELQARSERAASMSRSGVPPLENLIALLMAPKTATEYVDQLPCMAAHRVLIMFEACAEAIPVLLNNCAIVAANLYGYQLLRQLNVLEAIPLLDRLVKAFGSPIFLDGSVSKFATKWHAVLGGQVVRKKKKEVPVEVTDYKKTPDRISLESSFMLMWPDGARFLKPDHMKFIVPSIMAKAHDCVDKATLRKFLEGQHTPTNVAVSADISATWDECGGPLPLALINHFELYNASLQTLAYFHRTLETQEKHADVFGTSSLPNRPVDERDSAYSGISAFSMLLTKVDGLLAKSQRNRVMSDPAIHALAGGYRAYWVSLGDVKLF